jgi:peptidase S41-like protein
MPPNSDSSHAAVETAGELPASSITLAEFLKTPAPLDRQVREVIVQQALWMLESAYVHLQQKRAMYAIDPLQQLRLLRYRLQQTPDKKLPSALEFHREMVQLFASLRDLHTNYLLPPPYRDAVAYMPFMIEECKESDDAPVKCIVTKLAPWFVPPPGFAPGVEILDWNGVSIERAIAIHAEAQAGGNPAARHACGLDSLTIRPLIRMLPPDEHWVIVGYQGDDGVRHELRQDWLVRSDVAGSQLVSYAEGNLALGLDLQTRRIHQTRKLLFAGPAVEAERKAVEGPVQVAGTDSLETWMPTVFLARRIPGSEAEVGYIRIYTFMAPDADAMVKEFIRLLAQLPRAGLILDVRGNGGGLIQAAEQMLQLLTPRRVEPERFQFINSPFTLKLSRRFADLNLWTESIAQSVETGAPYSLAYPLTSEASCNAIGQRYFGPVVLITDATCFSATDMFVAGFHDHAIGRIVGVSDNTGAGGANVWRHGELRLLANQLGDADAAELPGGVDMRVAVRRSLRVGDHAGVPVEDLGIAPDVRHDMTRGDVLNGNAKLLEEAVAILRTLPSRWLEVTVPKRTRRRLYLSIEATNLSALEVVVNDRSVYSAEVEPAAMAVVVPLPAEPIRCIEICGLDEHDDIVARYRIPLDALSSSAPGPRRRTVAFPPGSHAGLPGSNRPARRVQPHGGAPPACGGDPSTR